jgi:hypothetical protein
MEKVRHQNGGFGWVWLVSVFLLAAWPAMGIFTIPDRPDLLDGTGLAFVTTQTTASGGHQENIFYPGFGYPLAVGPSSSFGVVDNFVAGRLQGSIPGVALGTVFWYAFEPDHVTRTAKKDSFAQGNYLWIQVGVYSSGTSFYTPSSVAVISGCKAAGTIKDKDGDGSADWAKWSVKCADSLDTVLGNLGLGSTQIDAFKAVFSGKTKIKFKGKTTNVVVGGP